MESHSRNPRIHFDIATCDVTDDVTAEALQHKSHVLISLMQDYRQGTRTSNSMLLAIGFCVYKVRGAQGHFRQGQGERRLCCALPGTCECTCSRDASRNANHVKGDTSGVLRPTSGVNFRLSSRQTSPTSGFSFSRSTTTTAATSGRCRSCRCWRTCAPRRSLARSRRELTSSPGPTYSCLTRTARGRRASSSSACTGRSRPRRPEPPGESGTQNSTMVLVQGAAPSGPGVGPVILPPDSPPHTKLV